MMRLGIGFDLNLPMVHTLMPLAADILLETRRNATSILKARLAGRFTFVRDTKRPLLSVENQGWDG